MSIMRINRRENPFTQIDCSIANDERLTLKAKGLMLYLLSKPNHWRISVADVAKRSRNGQHAIYSALRELRRHGYAILREKRQNGKISAKEWEIYENPRKPPHSGFRDEENIGQENRHVSNMEYSNKDCRSKKFERRCDSILPKDKAPISPFISTAITKLENHVRSARRLSGQRIDRQKWARDLTRLLKDIGQDKKRFKRVLKAYITMEHDQYTPLVCSASSFRAKFIQIEAWAKRNGMDEAAMDAPKIVRKYVEMSDEEYERFLEENNV